MMPKENREKEILLMANAAKTMLRIHGFLTDKETENIQRKLERYCDKNKIEVTSEEFHEVFIKIKKSCRD